MAEPTKRGDRYRHIVMINGRRHSGTFDTKKEARLWESSLRLQAKEPLAHRSSPKLTEAVDKYLKSVSTQKRNAVTWETRRFNEFISAMPPGIRLHEITSEMLGDWRDKRLQSVTGTTVLRESSLIRNLFTVAVREWKWIESNPYSGVRLPPKGEPRKAVWRWQQIRRILRAGKRSGGKIGEVAIAFHIALRTALRLQEALSADTSYDPKRGVFDLPPTKTAPKGETVPTTRWGRRVMAQYADVKFTVEPNEASTLFSRLCRDNLISGLQYRDARATALTMLARRVDILTLARISRHRNMELLRSTYYRETAEEISARL